MHHLQQLAQPTFGKSGFVREPAQVLGGNVVNRDAVRREMLRPVFAKRHAGAADLVEISAHPAGEIMHALTGCTGGNVFAGRRRRPWSIVFA